MFSNLIYFIVVLLFYNIYHPPEVPTFSGFQTLLLGGGLVGLFVLLNRFTFRRLERRLPWENPVRLDRRFTATVQRHAIVAIGLFVINLYLLNLPDFLRDMPVLRTLPTLLTAMFLALFTGYLSIVWWASYPLHCRLYMPEVSLRSYILSQVRFGLPILLPWFLLSGSLDIVLLLPMPQPAAFLNTPLGEVTYFLFFLMLVAITGPLLVQKFWGCQPLPEGTMRARIAAVCNRAGLRYADILYWPIFGGRMITAGVMGLVARFRYLLVTRGLLEYLHPLEIETVIAHEIGHIKKHHLLLYLLFFSGYLLLSLVTFEILIFYLVYSPPLEFMVAATGVSYQTALAAVFSGVVILFFLLYFRYVFGYFMRNFERQADTFVYHLFYDARPLISTLHKIAQSSGQDADKPNWHHFSIAQRIHFLQCCEMDRSWIQRHDRKVRISLAIYLLVLLAALAAGYSLSYGTTGEQLKAHIQEQALLRLIEKEPHRSEMLVLLGDYHYSKGREAAALEAYRKALQDDPHNSHALNNLAWLYATSELQHLRNPRQALALALKAVALNPASHVLDTLAESYYVNGLYQEAVHTARRALAAADDPAYYVEQLERFRRMVE